MCLYCCRSGGELRHRAARLESGICTGASSLHQLLCGVHLLLPLVGPLSNVSLPTRRWAAQKRGCCSSALMSSKTSPQCSQSAATRCFWWSLYICEVITLVNIVLCAFKILDGWQCICAEIKWQLQKFSDIKVYVLCTESHLPQAGRLYIVAFYVRCIKWQEVLWCLSVVGFKSAMKHGRSFPWGNHTCHVWFVCHPHTCHPQDEATE